MSAPAQAELETFRQQWREEVAARSRRSGNPANSRVVNPSQSGPGRPSKHVPPAVLVNLAHKARVLEEGLEWEPRTYHDLENKEEILKLGNNTPGARDALKEQEPQSALEHYERAVERETQGKLGDSVNLYRKAFKV